MSGLETSVGVLRAAGEVTRLRVLALLAAGELSVKDLTTILDQSQPRISRHLKLLVEAGLVVRYAEGAWAYFGLAREGAGAELVWRILDQLDQDDAQISIDINRLHKVREHQRERATAYFASVADSWDLLRSLHVPEEAVEAAISDRVGARKVDLLLDLGTGTGRMLELLAGKYRHGIGIDSSREMLAVARSKLNASRLNHARIRLGDIAHIDAGEGPADLIVFHQVLHYFDDPGQIIRAARKALVPGGEMLIVDFAPHRLEFLRAEHAHRRLGISSAQMQDWAGDVKLKVTDYADFPGENGPESLTVCLWTLKDDSPATAEKVNR